jgi:hypothetical protein
MRGLDELAKELSRFLDDFSVLDDALKVVPV